ncbi:hypothetical protein N879_04920 [Alcaligenes sp. EGD-AK7]|nr:hypothetical protein N879_04920 [Alcaligenes sp. EGD-AK7]
MQIGVALGSPLDLKQQYQNTPISVESDIGVFFYGMGLAFLNGFA